MEQPLSIFTIFGGIRPMARAIGVQPSTVSAWKRVGRIPAEKQPRVLERAIALGLPVTAENIIYPLGLPACDHDAACQCPRALVRPGTAPRSPASFLGVDRGAGHVSFHKSRDLKGLPV